MASDYRHTIACVAGIALLLVASQAHTQDLRRINYGTTTSSAHLPVWVAKDAGLFSKASLNVEPVQIRGSQHDRHGLSFVLCRQQPRFYKG
jgi:ABC-type nitrate/sulfonate/bicarbonate transport system substrate-binding protein